MVVRFDIHCSRSNGLISRSALATGSLVPKVMGEPDANACRLIEFCRGLNFAVFKHPGRYLSAYLTCSNEAVATIPVESNAVLASEPTSTRADQAEFGSSSASGRPNGPALCQPRATLWVLIADASFPSPDGAALWGAADLLKTAPLGRKHVGSEAHYAEKRSWWRVAAYGYAYYLVCGSPISAAIC